MTPRMSDGVAEALSRIEERQLIQDKRLERIEARLSAPVAPEPSPLALAGVVVPGGKKVAALIASLSAGAVFALAELVKQLFGGR